MRSVGPGVWEIRIREAGERQEANYVLHAFEKRTRKTAKKDIDLARHRYAQVIARCGQR